MFLRHLAALGAALFVIGAHAAGPAPAFEAGKNYFVIDPPVATTSGDKIEVTEVFSYGCPACNFAYPTIDKIKKSLPPNAVMTYVPASFNPNEDWPMFQRAYLTAVAMGVADKSHDKMFDAVWKDKTLATMNDDGRSLKKDQPTIEDAAKWYAQFGVKPEEFVATANSFTIATRMKQADAYIKAAGVDSTPTLVVAGKYRFTIHDAGGLDEAGQLVHYLIGLESKK
ncbi:MAG TPA: thiol:disulfide interchange protein DsbA/DsbL [Rudaea sp.]